MISTTLMICLAIASAVIVIALMRWKPRNRFPAAGDAKRANWPSRDVTYASMLLSFAASVGLARAQSEQSGDGNAHSWHGSHLHHGSHDVSGGGFSDGGGGDGGGGGGI